MKSEFMDQREPISKQSIKILGIFSAEVDASMRDVDNLGRKGNLKPVLLEDFKSACHEIGNGNGNGNEILPDDLIERKLRSEIIDNAYVQFNFPPGHRCCPVVIPFNHFGLPLSENEFENGRHFHLLCINQDGKTISDFTPKPSFVFDLLPVEIQALAFEIPHYTLEDSLPFVEKYRAACEELKKIMS